MGQAVILAAPASGSGKTTLTLALLRALRRRGVGVGSAKIGPDYIDPMFHTAASGKPCLTIDAWAMQHRTFESQISRIDAGGALNLVEGVMGLFDGAPGGVASTAHVAKLTGWPIVLIIDASGMAASVAALVNGFHTYDPDVAIAGIIFNRVGSKRHGELLTEAVSTLEIPVLGYVRRDDELELPERHLGLVQAGEHESLDTFLDAAAAIVADQVDLDAIEALACPASFSSSDAPPALPVLGQRIALAQDIAFAFCYEFVLEGWRRRGVEVLPFSPLANTPPAMNADAVYLPGGYPELHAHTLSNATAFLEGVRRLAAKGCPVYGECGGYMVLGDTLEDRDGEVHKMCGLLPINTSFKAPKLHLGYRAMRLNRSGVLGTRDTRFRGHEFHFSTGTSASKEDALFEASNASGESLGLYGCQLGSVAGSYLHLIDGPRPHPE